MVRQESLTLAAALQRSGVDDESDRYSMVSVRPAPRWLTAVWGSGVDAMALPRVVFASNSAFDRVIDGDAADLLIHEAVHVDQWRRYGAAGFLARYLSDYLRGRMVGLPHPTAYRAIRFEREAIQRSERR